MNDQELDIFLDAVGAMPINSLLPIGAREASAPYIERHRAAGGGPFYTVWSARGPELVNTPNSWTAVDAYLELIGEA